MKLENNFFKLLGLSQQFEIDQKLLKKRLRELQRQYHPDRFAKATPHEQRLAAQFSAQVNTAASVLGNPVQRALHLLEQAGLQFDAKTHTETDGGFLIEQMELRETLEESREQRDLAALQTLADKVAAAYAGAQQDFSTAYSLAIANQTANQSANQSGDADSSGMTIDVLALLALVSKMRFFEKINGEVIANLNQLR